MKKNSYKKLKEHIKHFSKNYIGIFSNKKCKKLMQ